MHMRMASLRSRLGYGMGFSTAQSYVHLSLCKIDIALRARLLYQPEHFHC